ncbi:MAG: ABC transporter ATP-binding protein [Thermoprotei archaeon]|nr:MAG: ABC transporter ATP-binding protein [Thermoprotei archaeon]
MLLEVRELTAGYGDVRVIEDISFSLRSEELLAVLGPNGSGKSTLMKALMGLATIHRGKVLFKGEDVTGLKPHEKARRGIVYVPQMNNVFENLTVKENLLMAGYTMKDELWERIKEVLELLPPLKELMGRKAWTLSGGERQMLALAMALVRNPELLILDEPTASLAPTVAERIISLVAHVKESKGVGVILVEQNAKLALSLSDKALLMVSGRQVYLGAANELLSRGDISSLYLGIR